MKMKESLMKYDSVTKLPKTLLAELEIGIADVEADRVIPHKESMRQIREELGLEKV